MIILLMLMLALACLQVFSRYVINYALFGSDELIRYAFIWIMFLGLGILVNRGESVKVDLLYRMVNQRVGKIIWYQSLIFESLFFIFFMVKGIKLTISVHAQLTPALQLPKPVVYAAAPVGAFLALIQILLHFCEGFDVRKIQQTI